VLVGNNINKHNINLVDEIKNLKLNDNIELLGNSRNVPKIMNGIDFYVQSSRYGEGFPNVVAEAMACETPSVVTNTGDAAFIVKETGWVVPPKNSLKLSEAIKKVFIEINKKNWKWRCEQARLRILKNFSLNDMINLYNKAWKSVQIKNKYNKG
jgi:glycosyltransferase involved in cell wall biosynthesis